MTTIGIGWTATAGYLPPRSHAEICCTCWPISTCAMFSPRSKAPVLVQHRTGDRVVSIDRGRDLASAIAGAELREYDSDDHFAFVGDLSWVDDVERFVTGSVKERPARPSTTNVTISTLGRFGVQIDGQEIPTSAWRSRIPRQICKRLVAARGWPVTREELFDMCWPDETDTSKLGARLSVQLSAVRRVLGGGVIADRRNGGPQPPGSYDRSRGITQRQQ